MYPRRSFKRSSALPSNRPCRSSPRALRSSTRNAPHADRARRAGAPRPPEPRREAQLERRGTRANTTHEAEDANQGDELWWRQRGCHTPRKHQGRTWKTLMTQWIHTLETRCCPTLVNNIAGHNYLSRAQNLKQPCAMRRTTAICQRLCSSTFLPNMGTQPRPQKVTSAARQFHNAHQQCLPYFSKCYYNNTP